MRLNLVFTLFQYDSTCGVHKLNRMIYSGVCRDIRQRLHSTVCAAQIAVDYCTRKCMGLNDRQQHVSISARDNFRIPKCGPAACVHHSKDPHFITGGSSSVVLLQR